MPAQIRVLQKDFSAGEVGQDEQLLTLDKKLMRAAKEMQLAYEDALLQ